MILNSIWRRSSWNFVLNFSHPVFLWTLWRKREVYFSISKIEKIDQKLLKFKIRNLFLGNSTLNPMSTSVFPPEEVGIFSILIMSTCHWQGYEYRQSIMTIVILALSLWCILGSTLRPKATQKTTWPQQGLTCYRKLVTKATWNQVGINLSSTVIWLDGLRGVSDTRYPF